MEDHDGKGKVSVQILIPDDLVGALMSQNLKLLEAMRSQCSPVTIWIKARSSKRGSNRRGHLRTMLLRGDTQDQLDEARVQNETPP